MVPIYVPNQKLIISNWSLIDQIKIPLDSNRKQFYVEYINSSKKFQYHRLKKGYGNVVVKNIFLNKKQNKKDKYMVLILMYCNASYMQS